MDTRSSQQRRDSLRFHIASTLIFVIGTALSAIAFFATYSKEEQAVQASFNDAALSRVAVIKSSFDDCLQALTSAGAYFEADDELTRAEFAVFAKHINSGTTGIQAIEWVPRVPAEARATLEAQMRKDIPDFVFAERQANGKMVPRRTQAEYFPVVFVEPNANNKFALGFDVASNPTRVGAMIEARDSGKFVVSPRLVLLKEPGFLVFYPVYHKFQSHSTMEQRRAHFKGFAVGVFRLQEVVESGFQQLRSSGLDIGIYESLNRSPQHLLYQHTASLDKTLSREQSSFVYTVPLNMGERMWLLSLTPAPGRFIPQISWWAWAELVIGILLSAMLAAYVQTIRRHQNVLQQQDLQRSALISHFDYLVKYANDMIILTGDDGKIMEINDRVCVAYGYSRDELLQMTMQELSVDPLQQQLYLNMHGMGEEGLRYETVERRKDGSTFPVEVSARRLAIDGQYFWQAIARDITERKEQEMALSRVHRALRVLSECNMALVHTKGEQALLQEICRLIVQVGHYPMAWIGCALDDETKTVQPLAQSGNGDDYLQQINISWADNEHGQGPSSRAIREGKPQINQDFEHNPQMVPWRAMGIKQGFQASIAVPLRISTGIFGVITIYATEPNAFDEEEVKLLQELADDLGYGITGLREAQERQRIQRELDYQANYDPLTGLPNRNLLHNQLSVALSRVNATERMLAVAMLSLDRFDSINDGFGHAAGDALLKHVAKQLQVNLRPGDSVAHFSGDEFAVLISDIHHQDELVTIARHVLDDITEPFLLDDQQIFTTASLGIALYPKDGDNPDKLLQDAAAAMYKAKSEGGNTFRFYAPEMNERIAGQLALEIDLRKGLERNELLVYYQPKISLSTGRISGAEALVRWLHPTLGLLMPASFIGIAEETDLIQGLGEWVFQDVCKQLKSWREQGMPALPIAVNLSARQFRQENLLQNLLRTLAQNGVEPKLLELEITESTLMENADAAIATLHQLKELGFSVSLDDFGTGYSSLSYLKHLPLDHLKIDQSFVRNLTSEPDDAAICLAVIDLAHNLKLKVIAEGVETEGQLNYLCRHGCDVMQGYYFSPPLPAEGFTWLLNEGKTVVLPDASDGVKTLLLLDDDESVLLQLEWLLKNSNYQVFTANRVEEAFELLASYPIQVVISDQRMAAMDGTEFLARVREIYPDVLRMLMTGSLDPKTFSDSINRGAIHKFIPKPWDDEQLLEQIDEAFRYYESMHRGV